MLDTPEETLGLACEALQRVSTIHSFDWGHPVHQRTEWALGYLGELRSVQQPSPDRIYNLARQPLTPELRRVAAAGDVATWLGYDELPLSRYRAIPGSVEHPYWVHWKRSDMIHQPPKRLMKLYISAPLTHLPEVVRRSVDVLVDMGSASFKLGADVGNLARPDHFVVFEEEQHIADLAQELGSVLEGLPAAGVPFTLPIVASDLLSVAIDPKEFRQLDSRDRRHSWRSFLAEYLATIRSPDQPTAPAFWGLLGLETAASAA